MNGIVNLYELAKNTQRTNATIAADKIMETLPQELYNAASEGLFVIYKTYESVNEIDLETLKSTIIDRLTDEFKDTLFGIEVGVTGKTGAIKNQMRIKILPNI